MTDREAFIAAIVASPGDDLPRLAFADWLDEHDEPERAEFIRVGCEKEEWRQRNPGGPCCLWGECRGCELGRRETELFAARGGEWFGHLSASLRYVQINDADHPDELFVLNFRLPGEHRGVVRRGLLHTVRGPLAALREHLPALTAVQPVERVEVTDREPTPIDGDRGTEDGMQNDLGWMWQWWGGDEPGQRWATTIAFRVPRPIAVRLFQSVGRRWRYHRASQSTTNVFFPTEAAARDALSAALLAEAREQAAQPAGVPA